MKSSHLLLVATFCLLAWTTQAQDTNALKTDLGVFETQTGTVLVKGVGQVGEIAVGPDEIAMRCKETTDTSTGSKAYGVAIEIAGEPLPRERILIDDDELDSLLNGINYLVKINNEVTTLPGFEASYTTKAGLRIIADSIRKDGGVQLFLQYDINPRIPMSSLQLTQLGDLIEQARKSIADLKAAK